MALILKTLLLAGGRSMYIVFPPGPPRSVKRTGALIVLRDDDGEASVQEMLNTGGLARLAEDRHVVLAFPNPIKERWNWTLNPDLPNDIDFLMHIRGELTSPEESVPFPKDLAASANPLKDARFQRYWHPMGDVCYAVGFGTGASMVLALAALRPGLLAGLYTEGGEMSSAALAAAVYAPMPAYLSHCPRNTVAYFLRANAATESINKNEYHNPANPCQRVILSNTGTGVPLPEVYDTLFSRVRRPASSQYGDLAPRLRPDEDEGFTLYQDDTHLTDGKPRTWLVHVPKRVREQLETRVPLMVFFHGASDTPWEAADMSKFHELGERDGFITVYPWGSNHMTWNSSMLDDEPDDDAFTVSLIRDMIACYPVDPERVYLSGFSNGAAQAQAVAMCHPDLIAAVCPIDANWPGNRMGEMSITYLDVTPMRIGMGKKQAIDYRMPVWYTYGGQEISYPVYRGSTQQLQYDFWKTYNHIPVKPTPGRDNPHPCGCGVPGDIVEFLTPSDVYPEHTYDVHRFLSSNPEGVNLYNYVVMRQKGHEIAPADPELGWQYVRRFRRKANGSLKSE